MAHFAKLNENNIVTQVVVVNNDIITDENGNEQESLGQTFLRNLYNEPNAVWKQTSYNGNFRGLFAGENFTYDSDKDKFIAPQPYLSWVLNSDDIWEAPVAKPTSPETSWRWDEDNARWKPKEYWNFTYNPSTNTWVSNS